MRSKHNDDDEEDDRREEKKRKIMKKVKKFKMPKDKLLVMPNPDKKWHERWSKTRSKLNFPAPWRVILCGPPNAGKGVCMINLILAQGMDKAKGENKPFEEIYVVHIDGKHTGEYKNCGAKFLKKIPAPSFWDPKKKKLLILEDLSFKDMDKSQKEALKRCWGYCSTHKNLCCALTCQDIYDVGDPFIRRCTNLFVLFPSIDYTSLKTLNKKIGLKKGELETVFDKFCGCNHDSIWIDLTDDNRSPFKLRLNGFDVIRRTVRGDEEDVKGKKKKGKGQELYLGPLPNM